jgi:hypothetical protein
MKWGATVRPGDPPTRIPSRYDHPPTRERIPSPRLAVTRTSFRQRRLFDASGHGVRDPREPSCCLAERFLGCHAPPGDRSTLRRAHQRRFLLHTLTREPTGRAAPATARAAEAWRQAVFPHHDAPCTLGRATLHLPSSTPATHSATSVWLRSSGVLINKGGRLNPGVYGIGARSPDL